MVRLKIILLILLGGLFLPFFVFAQEKIDNFDVTIKINQDGSLDISERIDYDFGQSQRHGIFRIIPIKYKARGGNYNLRISDISVIDENGNSYNFSKSFSGSDIEIKIGDVDKLIIGKKTYIINYTIKRAINYFDSHDELYWNVTGNDWSVEIEQAFAEVILSQEINENDLRVECLFGFYGGGGECISNIDNTEETVIFFAIPYKLSAGQGMTIVVGVPKGVIAEPSFFQKAWDVIRDNIILILPFLVFIFLFYSWYKYGRDPKGRGIVCAQYDAPDKLTPLEVGTIIDERFDNKDLSAEIINLAVGGCLKIKRVVKKKFILKSEDYVLTKLKNNKRLKNDFEKQLLEALFDNKESVKISELKNKFYKDLNNIRKEVYETIVRKEYFLKNPNKVRITYLIIGGIFVMLGFPSIIFWGFVGIISVILSAIMIFIFAFLMPRKTLKGVAAKEHILGLKEYLSVAEKDRIEFHNAPQKNPKHFEKLLPFAMVLGVEKEWAKKFEKIYTQSPGWYQDAGIIHFNSFLFVDSLSKFSAIANAVLVSNPSSAAHGGSGFAGGGVGGGFGGGGGGSW